MKSLFRSLTYVFLGSTIAFYSVSMTGCGPGGTPAPPEDIAVEDEESEAEFEAGEQEMTP